MSEARPQSSVSQTNLAMLKAAYRQWTSGKDASVEDILDHFDDEVEMVSALREGIHDIAGSRKGKEAAAAYFEALFRDWEMISYDDQAYFLEEGGDDVVVQCDCEWRHRASGNSVKTRKLDRWTVRDGRIIRFEEMLDTLGFALAVGAVKPCDTHAGTSPGG